MKTFSQYSNKGQRDLFLEKIHGRRDEILTSQDCAFLNICEASLSRLWQQAQRSSFAILTAYRSNNSKVQNVSLNRDLRSELNNYKMGPHALIGHWQECSITDKNGDPIDYNQCPKNKLVDVVERSYFVTKPSDISDDNFRKIIFDLGKKYHQDGVVLKTEKEFGVFNPRNGQSLVSFGKGVTLNRLAQAFSQHIKKQNVPFVFEGVEKPDGLSIVLEAARKNGFYW